MSEHTPGPCYAVEGTPHVYKNWNGEQVKLATVHAPAWHENVNSASREAFANALLYAAATELLSIVARVVKECESTFYDPADMSPEWVEIHKAARAALTKAGAQP